MKTKNQTNPLNNNSKIEKSKISFFNEEISFALKNKNHLRFWIDAALQNEQSFKYLINYIFCNDNYLYNLNIKYLDHDTFTDIITFDYSDEACTSGDIYISVDRVKENSLKFNTSFNSELCRVMIHGILHLCGYKDKTRMEKKLMTEKEDYYLSLL